MNPIRRRRLIFLLLNIVTLGAFAAMMLKMIVDGGMTVSEWLIGLGFLLTVPYAVIGFWNSAIGLWLLHARPGVVRAMPGVAEILSSAPPPDITARVALLLTLRNEAPEASFERLEHMRASLVRSGQIGRFTFAILSDSSEPEVIAAEARAFDRFMLRRAEGEPAPFYRRRTENNGYKAGNIDEFLDSHGDRYDYFIPLDSDSLLSATVMLRMVATMQAHPEIGILQSLVVGMPSQSGFTRVFQFGMRHGMRVFTTGAVWWTADCSAYWGHNAVVRVAPFRTFCKLPTLPGKPPLGGAVLSHDQLEATYMRRAGFEVRVIPVESDSFEINPPTLLDFIRRELRWCQGNMQYFHCLATPGLKPVSRVQLAIAIGMYLGQAAWIAMIAVGCVGAMLGQFRYHDLILGMVLFVGVFFLSIAPKFFGALDVWLTKGGTTRYGGGARFTASVLLELVSSTFLAPIVALSVTLFLLRLVLLRQSVIWSGQNRSQRDLAWGTALRPLLPHTLAGIALAAALAWTGGPNAVLWGLPVITGLALAIPYTVWSARSALGGLAVRWRLFAIPEERHLPPVLRPHGSGPAAEPLRDTP